MPPPTWTGTSSAAAMRAITSRLWEISSAVVRAASRSTRWITLAFITRHSFAMRTGSSK